ncbi:MAG: hypothetical protein ACM3P0_02510, partial [Acidobacteriota bacterium]
FKKRTAVEEGTTTADSLSFKGGMRNYVYSSTASQQYLIYYKACAITGVRFSERKVDEEVLIIPNLRKWDFHDSRRLENASGIKILFIRNMVVPYKKKFVNFVCNYKNYYIKGFTWPMRD